jgi:hypothetical protein
MATRVNVTPGQVQGLLESLGRITVGRLILADELSYSEITQVAGLFQPWVTGETVVIGDLRRYESKIYECIQAHTTQSDWTPDIVPALWKVKAAPGVIPAWTQPAGAHDAYKKDDKVTYNSQVWISTADANVWEPGVYGWVVFVE